MKEIPAGILGFVRQVRNDLNDAFSWLWNKDKYELEKCLEGITNGRLYAMQTGRRIITLNIGVEQGYDRVERPVELIHDISDIGQNARLRGVEGNIRQLLEINDNQRISDFKRELSRMAAAQEIERAQAKFEDERK